MRLLYPAPSVPYPHLIFSPLNCDPVLRTACRWAILLLSHKNSAHPPPSHADGGPAAVPFLLDHRDRAGQTELQLRKHQVEPNSGQSLPSFAQRWTGNSSIPVTVQPQEVKVIDVAARSGSRSPPAQSVPTDRSSTPIQYFWSSQSVRCVLHG